MQRVPGQRGLTRTRLVIVIAGFQEFNVGSPCVPCKVPGHQRDSDQPPDTRIYEARLAGIES